MAHTASFVQKGDTIDYVNSTGGAIPHNNVVVLTNRIGVSLETIAEDATGGVRVTGVFELPSVENAAFAVGDILFWDADNEVLTKTEAGNAYAGWCTEVKATAGATARVKLDGVKEFQEVTTE